MNIVPRDSLPLFSFIIGLGVAICLFRKPFYIQKTLAVPLDTAESNIVKMDGKCFRYHAQDTQCKILSSK